jgi:hypothetical protein
MWMDLAMMEKNSLQSGIKYNNLLGCINYQKQIPNKLYQS